MASEERFGYEWDIWSKKKELIPEFEEQFLEWILPISKEYIKGKKVLNAGCGFGRHSLFCLDYGAKEVISFDNNKKSIDATRSLLKKYTNSQVKLESIHDISYKDKFDVIFCIGVIHHLKYPKEAMLKLKQSLRKGGVLMIMVYSKEGNMGIRIIRKTLSFFTSKMPLGLVYYFSLIPTIGLYLGMKIRILKTDYYQIIKKYNFKHLHLIVFDHLIPTINKYYSKKEAIKLMEGLNNIKIRHSKMKCWSVIGYAN